jgi:hypothetical protein
MIRAQCEEALQTTFAASGAAANNSPSSSHHNLTKSTSNLTASQYSFQLIGSTDFSSVDGGGQSIENSAYLIQDGYVDDQKRGWDWRKGCPKGAKGEEVVRLLRLGVARELARAFAEGDVKA